MLTPPIATKSTAEVAHAHGRRAVTTVFCLLVAMGTTVHFIRTGQLPCLHRVSVWSIAVYEGSSPFDLAPGPSSQPLLTARDVSDVPAMFVADPFMVRDGDTWYMFIEVFNKDTHQGDIGLATSHDDGLTWKYDQIVLDEPFHMSYPSVFRWQDKWYMLPESHEAGQIRLYEAQVFPRRWQHVHTCIVGKQLADPTLFRHDGRWWMFVGRSHTHDRLQLFFADHLFGEWTEHPRSPLIEGDPHTARPGGPVVRLGNQLYRHGQDCSPKYGLQLRAFRITKLTTTEYVEEPLESGPVLTAGAGWNAHGMHHSDPHLLPDGTWRAVVDGHHKVWVLE